MNIPTDPDDKVMIGDKEQELQDTKKISLPNLEEQYKSLTELEKARHTSKALSQIKQTLTSPTMLTMVMLCMKMIMHSNMLWTIQLLL